jgi:hemerythrin
MMDWDDSYSVGNERIDFQHKIFLKLLNEFNKAMTENAENGRLCRILNEVIKYAEYHFMSEENLMMDYRYPDLDRHKIIHNYLLSQAKTKAHEMELGFCEPNEVMRFLHDWFILHISHEDKKLGKHIKAYPSA